MKISKRKGSWIMMLAVVLIMALAGIVTFASRLTQTPNENWHAELENINKMYQENLDSLGEGEDLEYRQYLEKNIAINNYRLENDIEDESLSAIGFVVGGSDIMPILIMFVISIIAGVVAKEFSDGTIKLLLIRPSERWKILLSKYIASLIYALKLLLVLWASGFIVGLFLHGFSNLDMPYIYYSSTAGIAQARSMIVQMFIAYGYGFIPLIIYATMAFMISVLSRSNVLAIVLSMVVYFMGSFITQILIMLGNIAIQIEKTHAAWAGVLKFLSGINKYLFFNNTDLTVYADGTPPIEGMTLAFSVTVLIIYFAVFNIVSFVSFKKRDVLA